MKQPLVHVIIVNWNRWEDTARCVTSVMAMAYDNLQVVVVDNHSERKGDEKLKEQWPCVRIIHSPKNVGFAAGVNLGIRHALTQNADYIFTLNNDTIVASTCLTELLAVIHENSFVCIVGPKIYYMNPPFRIWFAGANRHPWLLSLLDFRRNQPDDPTISQPEAVNYLCAGAMLVRRELFEAIGLFDPGYFMYYEDCDFCMRANKQRYRLYYVPTARVWHQVAASSGGEGSPMEHYFRTRSVFRFLWQQSRGCHRLLLLLFRLLYVAGFVLYRGIAGQTAVAQAIWHGVYDGLTNMTTPPQERSL